MVRALLVVFGVSIVLHIEGTLYAGGIIAHSE